MKALILAALILSALPAAAQTNAPVALTPGGQNQFLRQQQIEAFRRDQQLNEVRQQQEITPLQEQIDDLKGPNVNQADLNRLQLELDRLQNEQQLARLWAERRIYEIEGQGDTARRRRWAAQFIREQQTQRLAEQQRLADIQENLRRLRGQ